MAKTDLLTRREQEVVHLLASSLSIQGIAGTMNITNKTVEKHIGQIYGKVGLGSLQVDAPELRKIVVLIKAYWLCMRIGDTK
ncbi:MAG: helix-turn-helix transcriptional regulator [Chloroflexota bacterium]